jgi:hypothetical protein
MFSQNRTSTALLLIVYIEHPSWWAMRDQYIDTLRNLPEERSARSIIGIKRHRFVVRLPRGTEHSQAINQQLLVLEVQHTSVGATLPSPLGCHNKGFPRKPIPSRKWGIVITGYQDLHRVWKRSEPIKKIYQGAPRLS